MWTPSFESDERCERFICRADDENMLCARSPPNRVFIAYWVFHRDLMAPALIFSYLAVIAFRVREALAVFDWIFAYLVLMQNPH